MKRLPSPAVALLAVAALSACSSTQDVLEPSSVAASPPAPGVLQAEIGTPAQSSASANTAVLPPGLAANTRLRFDPVVGATPEIAAPLTQHLLQTAQARGIVLSGGTDPSTTHVLKGYFSILTEGGQTTVIYVWDVYDKGGNRLHRINGQQKAPASRQEGWAAVVPATLQAIADATIDQFVTWLAGSGGQTASATNSWD